MQEVMSKVVFPAQHLGAYLAVGSQGQLADLLHPFIGQDVAKDAAMPP